MKRSTAIGWLIAIGGTVPVDLLYFLRMLPMNHPLTISFAALGIAAFPISLEALSKSDYYFHKALLAHNESIRQGEADVPSPSFLPITKEGKFYIQDGITLGSGLPHLLNEQPQCRSGVIRQTIYQYSALYLILFGNTLAAGGLFGMLWEPELGVKFLLSGAGCIGVGIGFTIAKNHVLKVTVEKYTTGGR